jgi:hypothetical protein
MIKHSETAYNLVTKASKFWWREGATRASAEAIECTRSLFFIYFSASAIPRRCVPFAELSRVPESWMAVVGTFVHLHLEPGHRAQLISAQCSLRSALYSVFSPTALQSERPGEGLAAT